MKSKTVTKEIKVADVAPMVEPKAKNKFKLPLTPIQRIIALHVIVLLLVVGLFLKNWYIVALVNNSPINRLALETELEKQGGKQVLDNMITENLIFQEAAKQKVTVSQADIDTKLKEIEKQLTDQGQNLDNLLSLQGQTRADLTKQIKIQLLAEKMVGKDLTVTDKQISDSFEANKATYPKGTTLESKKAEITDTLKQQELSTKIQTWITDIKAKAKIQYNIKI